MEDELKIPLRSLPNDYTDRVMTHIARAETRAANRWIAAQIAVTGVVALVIAIMLGSEIIPLMDSALEIFSDGLFALAQFFGDVLTALNEMRFEPLESIAPFEWMMLSIGAGIVWLAANGWLISNWRKEKFT